MLGDASLGGLAEVVPEVPPVCDLDRLGCASGGALGEEWRPVPADDLDAGPLREPGCEAGRFPVGRHVDRLPGLDIHQDSPVMPPLAGRVLVDTDHPRGGRLRFR
ncbi:hypothetical protein VR46_33850 [Streptomyces sp. NRRL S-444]|nr:hypothetical protein VR46_33850 [Streptomyces sp. NRRL S-444]